MKQSAIKLAILVSAVMLAVVTMPTQAVGVSKDAATLLTPPPPMVSHRLIVKMKAGKTIPIAKAMSVSMIRAELSKPLSVQAMQRLQSAAGMGLQDIRSTALGAHVLSVGEGDKSRIARAIAGIAALPEVEYVEEDRIQTIRMTPNDAYYITGPTGNPGLWGMRPANTVTSPSSGATGSYGADFQTAWDSTSGSGVVVAVIDTGIIAHADIVGAGGTVSPATGNLISSGYTFITDCRIKGTCVSTTADAAALIAPSAGAADTGDFITYPECSTASSLFYDPACMAGTNSSWHGTHVAGTIAAVGNDSSGVIGGAYGSKILPIRALGKGGGYTSDIADSILWAADLHPTIANLNPAHVINMSLGSTGTCSVTEQDAINAAVAAGVVVVVAAGNENMDVANASPANCQNVISVAAIARDGSRASYSNYSSPASNTSNPVSVTLAAPGGDQQYYLPSYDPGILSTVDTGATNPVGAGYAYYNGTSMATPHVAAAVGLMLATNPALTPAEVKLILSSTESLTSFPSFISSLATWDCATRHNCGAGVLNANRAVRNSIQALSLTSGSTAFGTKVIRPNGYDSTITLADSGAGVTTTSIVINGSGASQFSVVSSTCNGVVIPAAGTCQITVNYNSSTAGTHSAVLTVKKASGVAVILGLTGASGPALTASPSTQTASTVTVGNSTSVSFTFTNPNATSETLGTISFSNPSIMAAAVDNCSGAALAAGASCDVEVTLSPTAAGFYSETASLGLAIASTPATVTIQGVADPAPAASSGGGGGCSIMPFGATPDASLILALLAVGVYWVRRRKARDRSAT